MLVITYTYTTTTCPLAVNDGWQDGSTTAQTSFFLHGARVTRIQDRHIIVMNHAYMFFALRQQKKNTPIFIDR